MYFALCQKGEQVSQEVSGGSEFGVIVQFIVDFKYFPVLRGQLECMDTHIHVVYVYM